MFNDNTIYSNFITIQFQDVSTLGQQVMIFWKLNWKLIPWIFSILFVYASRLRYGLTYCFKAKSRGSKVGVLHVGSLHPRCCVVRNCFTDLCFLKCITTARNIKMTATEGKEKAIIDFFVYTCIITFYKSMRLYVTTFNLVVKIA